MYQITTASGVIGYTETVGYCYQLSSGSPQIIGRKERARGETAVGIIYGSSVYNLPGHDNFEGAETAWAVEVGAAAALNGQLENLARQETAQSDLDALTVDHELRLSLLELGVEGGES